MKKILLFIALLVLAVTFADSARGERSQATDSSAQSDAASVTVEDGTTDTATVTTDTSTAASNDEARSENHSVRDTVRARMEHRMATIEERMHQVRDRMHAQCANTTDDRLHAGCERDREELETLHCEQLNDSDEQAVCEHRGKSVEAHALVRYRQNLSDQCRELTSENRSRCERRVNDAFKEYMRTSFHTWAAEHRNMSDEEKNATRTRLEAIRERLQEKHAERKEELKNRTDAKKQELLERLDHAISRTDHVAVRMQNAIDKAQEKGHDTAELEFLLDEFNQAADNAKTYYDNEQYRDAVGALKDVRRIEKEFGRILHSMVQEHRAGLRHRVDTEHAFNATAAANGASENEEGEP